MKHLLALAGLLAAMMAVGAVPTQAAGLKKREHRLEKRLEHRQRVWARKQNTWARNHPRPHAENRRALAKWDRHFLKKTAKLERKESRVHAKLARRRH